MMDAEEKTAFYLNIPLFMRNCPHMFLMQQNMMAQQQQMQRQMAGQGAGIRSSEPSTSTSNSNSNSTSTSIAPGVVTSEGPQMMAEMLSDPGSKERLTTLSTRVTGTHCYCYYYCYCYCYCYCYGCHYHFSSTFILIFIEDFMVIFICFVYLSRKIIDMSL